LENKKISINKDTILELKRQLGLITGILVIVADMIGTGIFMTTGNILGMTNNALIVLILWAIGGLVAICGSLSYAELSTIWPDVGGEYVYLKKIFGFLPAFLTGWISLTVGFSAPVATSSLLLIQYLNKFLHIIYGNNAVPMFLDAIWVQKIFAIVIIIFFAIIHIIGVKKGSSLQNILTFIKIFLILLLIVFGLCAIDWNMTERLSAQYIPKSGVQELSIPLTGLALLMIMFAYSGWNCASYIAGEIKNPEKNLHRTLLIGTSVVMVIYLLLNIVYLMSVNGSDLMGKDEVGAIASSSLFGAGISGVFTLGITLILLSAVSVQMMVGPRVYYAMAKDKMIFQSLAKIHPTFETPYLAIIIQMVFAIIYVFTGTAMTLIIYMGFALNIFPVLAVIGLIYIRYSKPEITSSYKVPLFPVVPLIYIILTVAMMIAALLSWTTTSIFAIGIVIIGIPVFYIWESILKRLTKDTSK
jgi:basic amino acid/polyamine antiporter, APA family